jgi:Tfp pilus assembly protein FimT
MAAARDVLSDLEYARAVAIKENASVVVEFDTADNSFRVWVDNGAAANTDNWTQDGDERTFTQATDGIDNNAHGQIDEPGEKGQIFIS